MHDIVTNSLPASPGLERLPRQASQDAFLAMTMFCLKEYENRNPVSKIIRVCRVSPFMELMRQLDNQNEPLSSGILRDVFAPGSLLAENMKKARVILTDAEES